MTIATTERSAMQSYDAVITMQSCCQSVGRLAKATLGAYSCEPVTS